MTEKQDIALQIEVQAALPDSRGVVFRTFMERDCPRAELDAVLDKLREAVDRQHAFADLEKEELGLMEAERIGAMHARNLAVVEEAHQARYGDGDRRGSRPLSHSEKQAKQQAHATLALSRDTIEMAKKKIERYRQRLNGHG